ncbi:ATP-binding cassette domain-containing protein, partial [Ruminococcaceae bacterium OttesenSCG-928-A11]|nr:ATP-binding cassette domain-containing protein [Ruminococcaceae bacterium OttesenSCG-928-A11]
RKQLEQIRGLAEKYGMPLNLQKRVSELAVGEQQRAEILKALYRDARLLILDEPTSVLTPQETREFFGVLRTLRDDGHSIIFIAHNLEEIMQISDRVTILRDGKNTRTLNTGETDEKELSRCMIGRDFTEASYQRRCLEQPGDALVVQGLSLDGPDKKCILSDVSFTVRQGEILGVAGVDGNGQLELAEVLCGIRKQSGGTISLAGTAIEKLTIRARSEAGLAYIPSDRHQDGLIMDADVNYNFHLRDYYRTPYAKRRLLQFTKMQAATRQAVEDFKVKTPTTTTQARLLSGGNQQKMILAREIATSAKLTIACQPTRGLDIGASEYLRSQLMELRNAGNSVLLVSTDLGEILALSDRIAVIFDGRIMGVLQNDEHLSVEKLGLMMGGREAEEVEA